jgi:DeoR family fructose operon transcriptional repressor
MTGGTALKSVYTLIGQETINFLSGILVNKLFLGCDAVHIDYGISNRTLEEIGIKRAMMKSSKSTIVCADSSKFGQRVFAKLCNITDVDMFITEAMSKKDVETFNNSGVKVLLPNHTENEDNQVNL